MNQSSKRIAFGLVLALVLLAIFSLFTKEYRSEPEIAFSDFLGSVERGDIEAVVIQGHYVHGSYKNGAGFKTFAPDDPELVNRDPYGDGWMVKVRLSDPSETSALMDVAAYKESLGRS